MQGQRLGQGPGGGVATEGKSGAEPPLVFVEPSEHAPLANRQCNGIGDLGVGLDHHVMAMEVL